MGLLGEAVADAESWLQACPDRIDALRMKARLFGKLGQTDIQCATLAQVCTLDPSHDNESIVGLAYLKAGRFAEAVQHYTRAVQLEPKSTKYRFKLAYALQKMGQFDRARAMLQTVLKEDPNHVDARDFLGKLAG